MSVYLIKSDEMISAREPGDVCDVCGERPWRLPFIEWHGHRNILICRECIHGVKNGLSGDLIHAAAIIDLQKIYPAFTLSRENIKQLEREQANNPDVVGFLKSRL